MVGRIIQGYIQVLSSIYKSIFSPDQIFPCIMLRCLLRIITAPCFQIDFQALQFNCTVLWYDERLVSHLQPLLLALGRRFLTIKNSKIINLRVFPGLFQFYQKHPFIAVDFSTDYAEFDSKYQLLYWCI